MKYEGKGAVCANHLGLPSEGVHFPNHHGAHDAMSKAILPRGVPCLTQEELKKRLHYDPLTGVFTRAEVHGGQQKGAVAGTVSDTGYRWISVAGKRYLAHRLAWLYATGEWPKQEIDHVNRVKDDNRLTNLRDVSRSDNCQNIGVKSNNSSGFTGVYWHQQSRRWRAEIRRGGRTTHVGGFSSPELAASAREALL